MFRSITKIALFTILLWSAGGTAFALGPADSGGSEQLTPTDLERVNVGSAAPDFTLEGEKGNAITLSQFRDQKNVVLVFYRGHW